MYLLWVTHTNKHINVQLLKELLNKADKAAGNTNQKMLFSKEITRHYEIENILFIVCGCV